MVEINPIIFIGGPARSGTTFVRDLLNSHREIAIGDEMPLDSMTAIRTLIAQLNEKIFSASWRNISDEGKNNRKYELLRYVIRSVTNDTIAKKIMDSKYFGVKTPFSDSDFPFFEESFGFCHPKFIICLRNPIDTWISIQTKMPHLYGMKIDEFKKHYTRSFEITNPKSSMSLKNTFLFQVDLIPQEINERIKYVNKLFQFLKIPIQDTTEFFVKKFPIVNKGSNLREESYEIKIKENAIENFSKDEDFIKLMSNLGYNFNFNQ